MLRKLFKTGNSIVVSIPREMLESLQETGILVSCYFFPKDINMNTSISMEDFASALEIELAHFTGTESYTQSVLPCL